MEHCEICDEFEYLADGICETCERVLTLDFTIDLGFEFRRIGIE